MDIVSSYCADHPSDPLANKLKLTKSRIHNYRFESFQRYQGCQVERHFHPRKKEHLIVSTHKRFQVEQPVLSSELDWALFGLQVSRAFVLETLVRECYPSLLRFTNGVLGNPSISQKIVREALANIAAQRSRKRGYNSARLLVYAQVIEEFGRSRLNIGLSYPSKPPSRIPSNLIPYKQDIIEITDVDIWGAFDGLDEGARIALILKCVEGLSNDEISELMSLRPAQLANLLERTCRRLMDLIGIPETDLRTFDVILTKSLNRRWPVFEFTESELNQIIDSVQKKYSQIRKSEKSYSALKYIAFAGCMLLVVLLGWVNGFGMFDKYTDSGKRASPERTTNKYPYWHTVWVDAWVYQYGQPGYAGPSINRHEQMWVTWRGDSLLISGPLNGEVDQAWLKVGENKYYTHLEPSNSIIESSERSSLDGLSNSYPINSEMIFETNIWTQGYKEVIEGNDNIAGRETLILDRFSEDGLLKYRLWVDISTGLCLRLLSYAGDGITVTGELYMSKIVYDIDLPFHVFDSDFPITKFVDG